MRQIEKIKKWLVITSAAIAGVFSGTLIDTLSASVGKRLSTAIVFIVVLFLLGIIQLLIENAVTASHILRKLLLRKNYVEGYWTDISKDAEGKLVGVTCVYIQYQEDMFLVSGTTLKTDNGMYASWDSKFATLQGRTLAYAFESHTSSANTPVELGYAELRFSQGRKMPSSYSGFFFDTTRKSLITLQGKRLADRQIIKSLENADERYGYLQKMILDSNSA